MAASNTELSKNYDPASVESEAYRVWIEERCFHAEPDGKGNPFAIVIPPPNVTAALHLGHALNNTLQDILTRWRRMAGDNAVWLPGTDHAGIATQTVVEKRVLQEEGKRRTDFPREEFVARIQAWKDEYERKITDQLKAMGCSCDFDRQAFTMDAPRAKAVREAFFRLFKDGLIYRGKRLVNWDPVTQTALADDEVEMEEIDGFFYYLRYPIVEDGTNETVSTRSIPTEPGRVAPVGPTGPSNAGSTENLGTAKTDLRSDRGDTPRLCESSSSELKFITVATTRPETMLGDTAVAINPKDPRAAALRGKHVRLPIVNRVVPIIEDDYVVLPNPESDDAKAKYASGFLKVTPAHDPNDWEIGRRHNLPLVNVMAPDASISDKHGWTDVGDAGFVLGKSREEARKLIVDWFKKNGLLEEVKPYRHAVGHSYRSHSAIEPYLSDQWYCKVTDPRLAQAALRAMAREQNDATSRDRETAGTDTAQPPLAYARGSSGDEPLGGSVSGSSLTSRERERAEGAHHATASPAADAAFPPGSSLTSRERERAEGAHHATASPAADAALPPGSSLTSCERKRAEDAHHATASPAADAALPPGSSLTSCERKRAEDADDAMGSSTETGAELPPGGWPLGYFITFTTYGTWLHGDDRGSVDDDHNIPGSPYLTPDDEQERREFTEMKHAPVTLDEAHRRVVQQTVAEVCQYRGWTLHVEHIRKTHAHIVVSANATPEKVMNDFQACATRRLREAGLVGHEARVWTRHGSTRYLNNEQAIRAACDYVHDRQGAPLEPPPLVGSSLTSLTSRERERAEGDDAQPPLPDGRGSSGGEPLPDRLPGSSLTSRERERARDSAVREPLPDGRGSSGDEPSLDPLPGSSLTSRERERAGGGEAQPPLPDGRGSSGDEPSLDPLPGSSLTSRERERAGGDDAQPPLPDGRGSSGDEPWEGKLHFYPARYAKTFQTWHENIRDWSISRQLWWGHRIPVWEVTFDKENQWLKRLTSAALRRQTSHGVIAREIEGLVRGLETDELRHVIAFDPNLLLGTSRNERSAGATEAEAASIFVCTRTQEADATMRQLAEELERKRSGRPVLSKFGVIVEYITGVSQDPDVLDTWFSSALWPISTLNWPDDTAELRTWNPSNVLCTAREIITLWVSRMVMFNLYFRGCLPFEDVFIHAMIQDGEGQKMSKSLGNGVDPLDIIHSHGADAMRYVLTAMTTQTQDLRMPVDLVDPHSGVAFAPVKITNSAGYVVAAPIQVSPKDPSKKMVSSYGQISGLAKPTAEMPLAKNTSSKFDTGRNFCNKIWNACRFALSNLEGAAAGPVDERQWSMADRWIVSRFNRTVEAVNAALGEYRFDVYAKTCYDFFWGDLCDWYVEAIKPAMKDPVRAGQTASVLAAVLDGALRLLHPMVPFITEIIWWRLNDVRPQRGLPGRLDCPPSPRLVLARWPGTGKIDSDGERDFPKLQAIIGVVRNLRNEYTVKPSQTMTVSILAPGDASQSILDSRETIELLAGCTLKEVRGDLAPPANAARGSAAGCEVFVEGLVDAAAEKQRKQKQCEALTKKIAALRGRMSNEAYMAKAPPHLVQQTRDELAAAEAEFAKLCS